MARHRSQCFTLLVLFSLVFQIIPPRSTAASSSVADLPSAAPISQSSNDVDQRVELARYIPAASSSQTTVREAESWIDEVRQAMRGVHPSLTRTHQALTSWLYSTRDQGATSIQREGMLAEPALAPSATPTPQRDLPSLADRAKAKRRLIYDGRQATVEAALAQEGQASGQSPVERLMSDASITAEPGGTCLYEIGEAAATPTIAAAFQTVYDNLGGEATLGCAEGPVYDFNGAPAQPLSGALLVYNATAGAAYYLDPGYSAAYIQAGGPGGFLGLPTQSSTDASAPPAFYLDYSHDFTGAPIQIFEHGFIGSSGGELEAARHFPLACDVGVTVLPVLVPQEPTETEPNPPPLRKKKLTFQVGGIVDPGNFESGDTFSSAVVGIANETTGIFVGKIMTQDGERFIYETEELVDADDEIHFVVDLYRQSDNFVGYAPQSWLIDGSEYSVPAGAGYFPLSGCTGASLPGGGGGYTPPPDTTPPTIEQPKLQQDGHGNIIVTVKVTDNRAVASVTLNVDGTDYPMLPSSGNMYTAVLYGLKLGKHSFYIGAKDTAGNAARLPASGTYTFKIERSDSYGQLDYQGYSPDPVNTFIGNYIYQYTDLKLVTPGPDLIIERFYNNQSSAVGRFGLGWTTLLDMRLTVMDNLLLQGAQLRYPDGRTVNFPADGNGFKRPSTVFDTLERAGNGYVLTRTDQTRYSFDDQGRLISIADPSGNTLSLTYNGDQLSEISSSSGLRATVTSDSAGRITGIDAPEQVALRYTYDGDGRLLTFTDGTGAVVTYIYDAEHGMIDVQTPQGHSFLAEQTFDDQGRVTFQRVGDNFINRFNYDDTQRTTTLTDSYGHTIVYRYDEKSRLIEQTDSLGHKESFTYNDANQRTSYTDRNGHTTRYTYNDQGDLLTTTDALGNTTTNTYDNQHHLLSTTDALGRVTRYEYDSEGRRTASVNALGERTVMRYNAQGQMVEQISPRGNRTTYTYNAQGNLIAEQNALGAVTRHEYDTQGRRIKTIDANGHATLFSYDANGNLLQQTDALGNKTTYTYDANNNRISETDANGHTTRYSYNHLDSLLTTTGANGGVTTITYDDLNHRIAETNVLGQTMRWELDANYRVITETNALGYTTGYRYDPHGNRLNVTDPRGNTTRYEYDALNRVVKTIDALGGVTRYEYDAVGNRVKETNANGATTEYIFDALNRVVSEKNALGFITAYRYDADGNRIALTDALGHTTKTEYDALNRVLKTIDALGGVTRYEYDAVGNRTKVIDPLGFSSSVEYDALNRKIKETNALGQSTRYEYDAVGNQTAVIDALGHTTRIAYDEMNQRVRVTDALGGTTQTSYDRNGQQLSETNANGKTTRYGYDQLGHTIVVTDALGFTKRTDYDPAGNQIRVIDENGQATSYAYDALNRVTSETNALGFTTSFTYDAVGNQIKKTDAKGHVTTYTYDLLNRRLSETNALGFTTRYEYDRLGKRVRTVFADSSITMQSYDVLGRLVSETDGEGFQKQYAYDAVGNQTVITDALGLATTTQYDGLRRPLMVSDTIGLVKGTAYDAVGNVTQTMDGNRHTTRMSYNALRRLVSQVDAEGHTTRSTYDAVGNRLSLTDGNDHTTRYAYDARNQLIAETNPLGHTTQYTYDGVGKQITIKDALGYVTRNSYDAVGQLVAVTLNDNSTRPADHSTNVTTRYVYDAVGNRTKTIDPNKHVVTFTPDALGQLVAETDPLGHITAYSYDAVGGQIERRDPNGNVVRSVYNRNGLLIQTIYADRSTIKRAYDGNRNLITLDDRTGTTRRSYDARGRLTSEQTAQGRVSYSYDGANNRTSLTYADGKVVRYSYDAVNRLRSVVNPDGATTTYTRDGVGQVVQQDTGNSTRTFQQYDAANQLLSVVTRQLSTGEHLLTSTTYTYNVVGQRLSVTTDDRTGQPKTLTERYGYDPLRRLAGVTTSDGVQTTYRYDAAGNRIAWQSNDDLRTPRPFDALNLAYTYDAADELLRVDDLVARKQTSYTYDANGNRLEERTGRDGTSYVYDAENQLLTAQQFQITGSGKRTDHTVMTAAYDGDGRRIAKSEDQQVGGGGAQTTGYVYDGLDPIATYQRWNNQYDNLYRADSGRILTLQRQPGGSAGQNYWYTQDALGNTTSLSQDKGQAAHTYRYDPFGAIVPKTSGAFGPHNSFTFTGQEYDAVIGLYHFHARTYDPDTATWLTRDPYRGTSDDPQSLHRYGYVKGNPVNLVDLYGYAACGSYGKCNIALPSSLRANFFFRLIEFLRGRDLYLDVEQLSAGGEASITGLYNAWKGLRTKTLFTRDLIPETIQKIRVGNKGVDPHFNFGLDYDFSVGLESEVGGLTFSACLQVGMRGEFGASFPTPYPTVRGDGFGALGGDVKGCFKYNQDGPQISYEANIYGSLNFRIYGELDAMIAGARVGFRAEAKVNQKFGCSHLSMCIQNRDSQTQLALEAAVFYGYKIRGGKWNDQDLVKVYGNIPILQR